MNIFKSVYQSFKLRRRVRGARRAQKQLETIVNDPLEFTSYELNLTSSKNNLNTQALSDLADLNKTLDELH